jgi:hypothetical protein
MRIAALVLGVLGAIGGFIGALIAFFFAGVVEVVDEISGAEKGVGEEIAILGLVAFAASVGGLVGGSIAIAKPKVAAVLMLVAAIVGVLSISVAFVPAAILLLIAALLAFLGRAEKKTEA